MNMNKVFKAALSAAALGSAAIGAHVLYRRAKNRIPEGLSPRAGTENLDTGIDRSALDASDFAERVRLAALAAPVSGPRELAPAKKSYTRTA